MNRSAIASSSAANPSSLDRSLAASISSIARYGAGAAPCTLPSAKNRAALAAAVHSEAGASGARGGGGEVRMPAAQRSDCTRKSAGSNITSAMPRSSACPARSILFCDKAFSMITLAAGPGPISRGSR